MTLKWKRRAWGPSESEFDIWQFSWRPQPFFFQSALRRTLASCMVQYANEDVPATNPGSGNGALYLRVLLTNYPDDPPVNWPGDPDVGDDVLFEPIVWQSVLAVPAGFVTGSTSQVYSFGSIIPGLADSKSQRKFTDGNDPFVHVFVGPLGGRLDSGPATDMFFTTVMLNQLWDDATD